MFGKVVILENTPRGLEDFNAKLRESIDIPIEILTNFDRVVNSLNSNASNFYIIDFIAPDLDEMELKSLINKNSKNIFIGLTNSSNDEHVRNQFSELFSMIILKNPGMTETILNEIKKHITSYNEISKESR